MKKLAKADRRAQLLETALAIVHDEGTDALSLGHLAERASVSKPIAYDHFKSRSGLLIALYKAFDDQQVAAFRQVVANAPRRLADVAQLISRAYIECCVSAGPEWQAISAALKGDEQMVAVQQELIDRYVALYCETLAPYVELPDEALRLRCVGFVGAADAISREVMRGRIAQPAAVADLTLLVLNWLSGPTSAKPSPARKREPQTE